MKKNVSVYGIEQSGAKNGRRRVGRDAFCSMLPVFDESNVHPLTDALLSA
jgi:hypothetical protein